MSETIQLGPRGGHSYTDSHRRSYQKNRANELAKARAYYVANAEIIKAKRLARYYNQKKLKLAAVPDVVEVSEIIARTTNISSSY